MLIKVNSNETIYKKRYNLIHINSFIKIIVILEINKDNKNFNKNYLIRLITKN